MNIILVGAASAIIEEVARLYANEQVNFYLLGRDENKLQVISDDLKARGAFKVQKHVFDFNDEQAVKTTLTAIFADVETIDLLLIGHGVLPDQEKAGSRYEDFYSQFQTNFLSVVSFLINSKGKFIEQKSGTIAVIGSVAGDRGRKGNYAYGSSKAAVEVFVAGLRNELSAYNVHVLTIKPGFVDTPMTAHLKKGPLFASASRVAVDIKKAIERKKEVAYVPFFWRYILMIICMIPEKIFKKLSI